MRQLKGQHDHRDAEEPSRGLFERIMLQIATKERSRSRLHVVVAGVVFLGAFSALPFAWRELVLELSQSGFWNFASLVISDAGILGAYWKDFFIAFAESFPTLGIAAVLGAVFVGLLSLQFFVRDFRPALVRLRRLTFT